MEACCTCARLLSAVPVYSEKKSEKPVPPDRQLACCGRVVCGHCLRENARFETYCPYCQISTAGGTPPPLLPQGLKEPPSYGSSVAQPPDPDLPPPYTPTPTSQATTTTASSSSSSTTTPTLHHLRPTDTIPSLSLAYGIPAARLRAHNRLAADHLLPGRRAVLIPPGYGSSSLSPRPVEGEAETARKTAIRRCMVAAKVADYDVAVLYLETHAWDLDRAVEAAREDDRWERENPLHAHAGKKGGGGGGGGVWPGRAAVSRRRG